MTARTALCRAAAALRSGAGVSHATWHTSGGAFLSSGGGGASALVGAGDVEASSRVSSSPSSSSSSSTSRRHLSSQAGPSALSSLIPSEVPGASQLAASLSSEQRAAMLEALLSHQAREVQQQQQQQEQQQQQQQQQQEQQQQQQEQEQQQQQQQRAGADNDDVGKADAATQAGVETTTPPSSRLTSGEMNPLFARGDTDGDEKLTRREFKILISRGVLNPRGDALEGGGGGGAATGARRASASLPKDVLLATFVAQAIPFIGFGFMDNAIMILAGEYIEMHLGAAFALSTMAAAGLGNLLSDIAGVGFSNKIEVMAEKMGFKSPELTKVQRRMRGPKMAKLLGAVIGITVGCLIGMFPLLFFDANHHHHGDGDEKKKKVNDRGDLETAAAK